MPKLARIPDDVTEQVYNTITEFGCARKRAVTTYARMALTDSEFISDEDKLAADKLAEKLMQELTREKRIETVKYAKESVVVPSRDSNISIDMLNAFEAYVAIVRELNEKGVMTSYCHAGLSEFPFDCVFAASNDAFYRVVVFNDDSMAKLNFINATNNKERDKFYTTLLVITDAYPIEEFALVEIKGRSRIALISQDKKHYSCVLSDVMLSN